jgi:hypothetical protein
MRETESSYGAPPSRDLCTDPPCAQPALAVQAKIFVVQAGTLFPRRDRPEFNASIAASARGDVVRYVNINDARGVPRDEMSEDGLRLSLAVYRVWPTRCGRCSSGRKDERRTSGRRPALLSW